MVQTDPITIATTWHAMQRICREMRQHIERTATNVLACTLHDLAYGIWDAKGQAIAIPEGFPCRLLSSTYQIRAVQKKFEGKIYPGDVFLTNSPFQAGAVHLPDWVFVRPIFFENELVFWTCMGTHVPDNGGALPGAYFLAFDSIAEGLNIPPVKVMERGELKEDVIDIILANNRLPDMMRREMRSLVGSTTLADQRIIDLLKRYGKETVLACVEEMINRTEKAVRAEIAKWPDGTYYAEAQTDDDGANIGIPVTIRCTLTIKGDEATFDFSESDAQVPGYANEGYSVTMSEAMAAAFMFLGHDLAAYHNEGSVRPIHIVAKEGTVTNCKPGALVAAAPSLIGNKVLECVMDTLSQALPERAVACHPGPLELMFIGPDIRTGQLYVYISFNPDAGAGATYGNDGYQIFACGGTLGVVAKADAEEEMVRFPWRITKYEFMTDSHGAGKWRSAPGVIWEGVNESIDCSSNMGPADGFHTQGKGQLGGQPAVLNKAYIIRDGEQIEIKEPHISQQLKAGDVFVAKAGGGAGVGRPEERDPEMVRKDVKYGLVSIEMARDVYKVSIDPETLEIYESATKKMRGEMAEMAVAARA